MIKIENFEIVGMEHAIRGMRNPMNSWEKSDSVKVDLDSECPGESCAFAGEKHCGSNCHQTVKAGMIVGKNDYGLMKKLAAGGPVHAKYRRMIAVYLDITAPLYWWAEMDTYKVGTVRNSCSFMHKGVSKPFDISDFSIKNEDVYKVLTPLERKTYELTYPYGTDEYKLYTDHNGRTYRVYRNGLVIREGFSYTDVWGTGRTRTYEEKEATVYQNNNGYFIVKLSGRNGGHMLLHRLVAELWCDKPDGATQVNHKDGDKGNNSIENLEWVTASENVQDAVSNGLYDNLGSPHHKYNLWKCNTRLIPVTDRFNFRADAASGMTHRELAEKWGITEKQANQLHYGLKQSEHEDLFQECYVWDSMIEQLNYLRLMYLETKDEQVFQEIRCLLPQGYLQKSTVMLNYEVLHNIYESRKSHRLDEWREFCKWIEQLPYSEIITGVRDVDMSKIRQKNYGTKEE